MLGGGPAGFPGVPRHLLGFRGLRRIGAKTIHRGAVSLADKARARKGVR
jgi:hypothetical protein